MSGKIIFGFILNIEAVRILYAALKQNWAYLMALFGTKDNIGWNLEMPHVCFDPPKVCENPHPDPM